MAHFLSEVTHDRLQQRANLLEAENPERVRTYIPGLVHTHDFAATLRCISVLERTIEDEKLGAHAVVKSWSGNLDGTISIRHGLDGKVVKTIPQEHLNVFVFALQQYRDTMWAGLSNGYLVVYEVDTTKKIFEAKAHGGAINRFLLGGDRIFIASADWQISQWNAIDMTRVTNGNFSGHTNAVRCIALDGSLLYSGGDDCVIRCWDLNTNTERTGTWPIIAHHDSVRDIVIFDSFLFSSSTDGTINVWNIRTAQLVRQLEVVNASITTLCLDTASNYLWAGSSDGNINIWNAANLSLVGVVDDHENTNVASVRQVARVDAIKAWTVCDDGNVRIWYADNNPTDEEYLAVSLMEAELQRHIEEHRSRIIANYDELERYKKELGILEQQSKTKKNNLAQLLGHTQSVSLERKHLAFAFMWLDKKRYGSWSTNVVAPAIEAASNMALIARYYAGWQAIARERHAARHKKEVTNYLAEYQKEISVRAYLLKLHKTQQATIDQTRRANLAKALAKRNAAIVVDRYYHALRRFVVSRRTSRQMEQLSVCLATQVNRRVLEAYWHKLLQASQQARADRISANVERSIARLEDAYHQSDEKAQHHERLAIADQRYAVLQRAQGQITPYQFQLVEDRDNSIALAALRAEEEEIRLLEEFIAENEGHDEDALDRELMEKQMELARVTAASGEDLEAQIRALEMRQFKLTREYEKDVIVRIDTQLAPLDQMDRAIYLLKANAVSCYHHQKRREEARARIAAAKSAEKIYKEAFEEVKKCVRKLVKPIPLQDGDEPEWFAPRERLDKIKPKATLEANNAIVDLCVAYDTLVPKTRNAWVNAADKQWSSDYKHNGELIANIEIFNTIALRAYRILRKLDPLTGEPVVESSLSPRRKSKSKSASPRGKSSTGSPAKKKKKSKKADGEAAKKKKKKSAKKTVPKKKKAPTDKKGAKKTLKSKKGKKKAGTKKVTSSNAVAAEEQQQASASPELASPIRDEESEPRVEEYNTVERLGSTAGPSGVENIEPEVANRVEEDASEEAVAINDTSAIEAEEQVPAAAEADLQEATATNPPVAESEAVPPATEEAPVEEVQAAEPEAVADAVEAEPPLPEPPADAQEEVPSIPEVNEEKEEPKPEVNEEEVSPVPEVNEEEEEPKPEVNEEEEEPKPQPAEEGDVQ